MKIKLTYGKSLAHCVTESKCYIILVTIISKAAGPITSWQIDAKTMETVTDFIFLGFKVTADGDCCHEIKRHLLLGRKAMRNRDSILKSRDITLPTKVHIVKATEVMYGCEKVKVAQSCLTLPSTIQSMKFSRPEYWSGEPFPSPGNLPNSGIEPRSPTLQADSLSTEPQGNPMDVRVGL